MVTANIEDDGPMDHKQADEEDPAWVWLKDLHDRGDHKTLDQIVTFWRALETLGRAGNLIRKGIVLLGKVLLWFAGILAGYLAATGDLLKVFGRSSGGS